jgi:hypothetical protein
VSKARGPDRGRRELASTGGWPGERCCARRTRGRRNSSTPSLAWTPTVPFGGLPSDLWGALVPQVIGSQPWLAAAAALLTRLEALPGRRIPAPAPLLATDAEPLRGVGMSRQGCTA